MDITTPLKFLNGVDSTLLSPNLLAKLKQAQLYSGTQLSITSGFRTPSQSVAVGGKINDAHTRGMAADIYCPTSQLAFQIAPALFLAGFKRIGYGVNHLHADIDSTLPQMVFWRE